jgi:hypothetical protein
MLAQQRRGSLCPALVVPNSSKLSVFLKLLPSFKRSLWHRRRMVIDDQPFAITLYERKTVTSGKLSRLPILFVAERIVATIDRRIAGGLAKYDRHLIEMRRSSADRVTSALGRYCCKTRGRRDLRSDCEVAARISFGLARLRERAFRWGSPSEANF